MANRVPLSFRFPSGGMRKALSRPADMAECNMFANRLGLRGRVTVTLLCLAIVSLLFGVVSYRLMVHLLEAELRNRLKNLAQLGALSIDADAFARLSAKASPDLPEATRLGLEFSSDYRLVSEQLNDIRDAEPTLIHYVYTLRTSSQPQEALFVVDADTLNLLEAARSGDVSEEISRFGAAYDLEPFPVAQIALAQGRTMVEQEFVYDEEYDLNAISGYAPIYGPDGRYAGLLGVDMSDADLRAALGRARQLWLWSFLFILTLVVGLLLYAFRAIARPFKELRLAAEAIGRGDFSRPVEIPGNDELSDFSQTFDRMRQDLSEARSSLESEVQERARAEQRYRLLFSGTQDLVIVLDPQFRVLEANRVACTLTGHTMRSILGQQLSELLDFPMSDNAARAGLLAELKQFREERGSMMRPLRIRRRTDHSVAELHARFEFVQLPDEQEEILVRASPVFEDPLLRHLAYEKLVFKLPNDIALVDQLVHRLSQSLRAHCAEGEEAVLSVALREIIVNAIEHGNLNITHGEKSQALDEGRLIELFRERLHDPRFRNRCVTVTCRVTRQQAAYVITDEGDGFDFAKLANLGQTEIERADKAHGRGIFLTRQFFDSVEYEPPGNRVRLLRRFRSPE